MMVTITQKVIKSGSMTFDENNIPLLGGDTPKAEKESFISLSLPPRTHEDTLGDNTKESTETQAVAEVTSDHDNGSGQTVEAQPASTSRGGKLGSPRANLPERYLT